MRRTNLNLLQVLEDLNHVLADHERVVCVFGVEVVPLVAVGICLERFLRDVDRLFDLEVLGKDVVLFWHVRDVGRRAAFLVRTQVFFVVELGWSCGSLTRTLLNLHARRRDGDGRAGDGQPTRCLDGCGRGYVDGHEVILPQRRGKLSLRNLFYAEDTRN